ncbi:MAG: UxaA family hydrolase [Anaerobutyricum hallii]|uniref:UxaA family hydrolase n=1 Tax=Anaerobutyricum hallii TaxID=39488 RepID=UPI002A828FA3|nr:UxaA family hydrolase [Anaerobutyricum hallii]MDY4577411.1 UxaA family hydrolase [Anaerobutyricum hallii]
MKTGVLRHQPGDTVGIAIYAAQKGDELEVKDVSTQETFPIYVREEIPVFHKIALMDMEKGSDVMEYGQITGEATENISKGQYVHVHNIRTRKW